MKYIKDELTNLVKGPNVGQKVYIYKNTNYMHYANLLERILLSLTILFDYDDLKETFKYIIYIFLPYFAFGFYFRDLMVQKELKKIEISKIKEKMNINDLNSYIKDNNNQIINYFKNFLKKLCLIKVLVDFSNKNQEIINSFNELTLDNLLSILDMEDLCKLLIKNSNNEINFMDIFSLLPNIFNENEVFYKLFENNFNYNQTFNNIFENVKENIKEEESIYEKDIIIQFAPIKFEFIHLDNNIFDWIERNIRKECDICKSLSRYSYICLICGDKVCHYKGKKNEVRNHTTMCGENSCLFVDMDNMELVLIDRELEYPKQLFPIYVNKDGAGPKGSGIRSEFNLSHEKLNLSLKNYACNDFK